MIKTKTSSYSHMGARHQQNDDLTYSNDSEGIHILCDGVSEGGQGKLAAELITKSIRDFLIEANKMHARSPVKLSGSKRLLSMQETMLNAFDQAQTTLEAMAQNHPKYKVASTTCIAVWLSGRFAVIAHIGDSRVYLHRKEKLYQLTKDHSGYEELIKIGVAPEVARKNPLAKRLTRALGNTRLNQPDILKIEFESKDTLILCTDGIYSALEKQQEMSGFISDVIQDKDMNPWVQKCSHVSGDDSSMIRIEFKMDDAFNDLEPTLVNIQASDRIELIKKTPLSKYLDFAQKSHIAALCDIHEVKSGTTVIREGDDGDSMYITAKGELMFQFHEKKLGQSMPGDFFGEIALIRNSKRTASAIAKTDAVLLSLNRNTLNEVFKKDPLIETRIYKSMLETVMDRFVALTESVGK